MAGARSRGAAGFSSPCRTDRPMTAATRAQGRGDSVRHPARRFVTGVPTVGAVRRGGGTHALAAMCFVPFFPEPVLVRVRVRPTARRTHRQWTGTTPPVVAPAPGGAPLDAGRVAPGDRAFQYADPVGDHDLIAGSSPLRLRAGPAPLASPDGEFHAKAHCPDRARASPRIRVPSGVLFPVGTPPRTDAPRPRGRKARRSGSGRFEARCRRTPL